MEKKPQVMVRFKSGDHGLFDLGDYSEWDILKKTLFEEYRWAEMGCNALVRTEDVDRLFYFPEGYTQNQPNVPQQ